ncbi:MAG: magnesium transporter [Deltaproteobacteria bacterium]
MAIKVKKEHIDEIKGLLEKDDLGGIERLFSELHPSGIGRVLMTLEEQEAVEVFKRLKPELASEVLLEVDERLRKTLMASISPKKLLEVLDGMETDDAADVISELPVKDARQVLDGLGRKESIEVQKLLVYPEDTAGGKMQAELVSILEDATVEETIEAVRDKAGKIENISNVFVVDFMNRLTGVVSLDKLILALPSTPIKNIADKDPVKVRTDLDQEEVAKIFKDYDLLSVPVVDHEGRLAGRITVDDIVDVLEDELFEDFYKMAGLNLEERVLDRPLRSIWMRAPWLLINLATAFLAASVVGIFEATIEKLVILAVLMPVVAGMGGNAATQTITIVVRGLALGELSLKNARWVIIKEALVGVANGLLTGCAAMAASYLLGANLMVGVILFLAMTANLLIAGLSGAFIPIVLKWLKIDPAISATVFVTTCTDIGGFFSFLGLATLFIKMGLL